MYLNLLLLFMCLNIGFGLMEIPDTPLSMPESFGNCGASYEQSEGDGGMVPIDELMNRGMLIVEPLTYIRGRTIPNQYMIVDEAQNLTPHEMKTIVTRVGEGTKIVLTGDPNQIDNPDVNLSSNGLSTLVERFKESSMSGHVRFTSCERSPLAELAATLL